MSTVIAIVVIIFSLGMMIAYQSGYAFGHREGLKEGYEQGRKSGETDGLKIGYDRGKNDREAEKAKQGASTTKRWGCVSILLLVVCLLGAIGLMLQQAFAESPPFATDWNLF
jgi:hypothetical protein